MELLHKFDAEKYEQPVRGYIGREIKDSLEEVDYLPESHLRIWYNTQEEGYATHHHSAVEVIICIDQPYNVTVTNQKFTLQPGDILIIPPHLLHSLEGSKKGSRFIGLFNIDMLNGFSDFKILMPTLLTPHLLTHDLTPQIYDKVYKIFMKIIDYYFSNEIMWEFSIYSKILELFALLGQYQYGTTLHDSKLDKSSSENFEKFATLLSYIDSHYATELDLEQAASLVGFSKFHFTRLFKEFTNCTFYDYLSQARIQAAQRLLSTNTSITDIAFQTGFNSLSSFCRCFKKYTNLSPSEYRDLYVKS